MATEKDLEQAGDHADDHVDVEDDEDDEGDDRIMPFGNILSELKHQRIQEMLASLPLTVKRRLKALKKLQLETTRVEARFFKEVHELECKYHKFYQEYYDKRNRIVNGEVEPTDEEADFSSDSDDEVAKSFNRKLTFENDQKEVKIDENAKGVPDFWLTVFKNSNLLADMIQPHDEPIFKHLIDIKSTCEVDPMVFTLYFHFSPNEWFTNTVLTKKYEMKCEPDADDPFNFEGPEIFKCTGCAIDWNKGKNVTVKVVKRKQKHKTRGVTRTVTKTVENDSFFNFFTPPTIPEDTKEEDIGEDLRSILTSDFEIGHFIRERIIPKAVLYFTGECIDEDEDEEDYEEEEDEDEEYEEGAESDNPDPSKNPNCKQQ